ncbi:MAG: hypothetical protein ABUL54_12090, partial [Dongia sp.]
MKTVLAAAFAIMIAATALPAAAQDSAPASTPEGGMSMDQKGQIEKIVHDYLMAHPEVIKEAIIALQAKEEAQKADDQTQAVAANK